MPAWLIALFSRYGYAVVIAAVLLENTGVPAPGHTVMLAGGALAQQGHLSLYVLLVCGALAAVAGDSAGYWIGRRGGRALLVKYGPRFWLTPERLESAEEFFGRHGAKTVVIGRFITGLQTVVALLAGSSGMPWWRFFRYNVAGAVAWSLAYGLAGFCFGASWHVLEKWVGRAGIFLVAAVVLGVLAFRARGKSRQDSATKHPVARAGARTLAGGIAVIASLTLFGELMRAVVHRAPGPLDVHASLWMHALDGDFTDIFFRTLAMFGSSITLGVVATLVALRAIVIGQRRRAAVFIASAILAAALSVLAARHFARSGPFLFSEVLYEPIASFPARPVLMTLLVYGLAAKTVEHRDARVATALRTLALVVPVAVGVAEIFLGRHWLTDVVAGYAAGAALLLVASWASDRAELAPPTYLAP